MKLFFKKVKLFTKKHWKVIALVVTAIVGIVIFKKSPSSFVESYRKLKELHDNESDAILNAHKKEQFEKKAAKLELNETLRVVENEFRKNNKILDNKKKKEIKRILRKGSSNPAELANELSKATGIRVIMPKP